jgi:hypothetical protein
LSLKIDLIVKVYERKSGGGRLVSPNGSVSRIGTDLQRFCAGVPISSSVLAAAERPGSGVQSIASEQRSNRVIRAGSASNSSGDANL